jgi:hypothetical protein
MGRRDIIVALTADEQGGGPTNGVQGFFNAPTTTALAVTSQNR